MQKVAERHHLCHFGHKNLPCYLVEHTLFIVR